MLDCRFGRFTAARTEGPMIRTRILPERPAPERVEDPSIVAAYLEDASGVPEGRADGLFRPADEAEAAACLRATAGSGETLLFQAARSSLTGGAVPSGETVLSVERMDGVGRVELHPGGGRVKVQPGVRLRELQRQLRARGLYYPPVPTYQEAMVGGTVATNAGGAASFKYGVTRQWVHGLRVLLADGELLELVRGQALARPGEPFRIVNSRGRATEVHAPRYRLPALKKISAGYFAADPLDLVDLFVGSEGTLGLVSEVTLDLVPAPPATVTGLTFLADASAGLELAGALREAARRSRVDRREPDVRAIEWLDEACLRLLTSYGDDRRLRIRRPEGAAAALLFEVELPDPTGDDQAGDWLASFLDDDPALPDVPLVRLFRILREYSALEPLELAFPQDETRHRALLEFREAAPTRVNERLAERRREDPEVKKVGGDLIVPFEHLGEMMRFYEEGFRKRGLEFAVWGHVSDGNLHPNAIAGSAREVQAGFAALLDFADLAAQRGGCPLSEHGVGRSPVKQQLLRRFLGPSAIAEMREIKRALDPKGRLAPGVLFTV